MSKNEHKCFVMSHVFTDGPRTGKRAYVAICGKSRCLWHSGQMTTKAGATAAGKIHTLAKMVDDAI